VLHRTSYQLTSPLSVT